MDKVTSRAPNENSDSRPVPASGVKRPANLGLSPKKALPPPPAGSPKSGEVSPLPAGPKLPLDRQVPGKIRAPSSGAGTSPRPMEHTQPSVQIAGLPPPLTGASSPRPVPQSGAAIPRAVSKGPPANVRASSVGAKSPATSPRAPLPNPIVAVTTVPPPPPIEALPQGASIVGTALPPPPLGFNGVVPLPIAASPDIGRLKKTSPKLKDRSRPSLPSTKKRNALSSKDDSDNGSAGSSGSMDNDSFGDFETLAAELKLDSLGSTFLIPVDDVALESYPSLMSSVPTADGSGISTQVRDTLFYFSRESRVISHQSEKLAPKYLQPPPIKKELSARQRSGTLSGKTPRRKYSEIVNEKANVAVNPELSMKKELLQPITGFASALTQDVFSEFSADATTVEQYHKVERKLLANEYVARWRAIFHSAQNVAGCEEPFWFTAAIYDTSRKVKLTETFNFNWNFDSAYLQSLLTQFYPKNNSEGGAKQALFNLSELTENMYLVIRVSVVLQGTAEDIVKTYTGGKLSQKDHAKWQENAQRATKFLGGHRQGLGWAAIRLVSPTSQKPVSLDSVPLQFYREKDGIDDETIFEFLTSEEKLKKLKQLELSLTVSLIPIQDDDLSGIKHLVDPSLAPYKAYSLASPTASDIVKEIHEFEQPWLPIPFFSSFVNNIYIHPLEVSIATGKVKAKSVAVRVYLTTGPVTQPPVANALPNVFCNSAQSFTQFTTTTVNFEQKRVALFDEFKVKLPLALTEQHRLVFEFLSVDTKILGKKKDDVPVETVLGYSSIPLFHNLIIHNGEHVLPIEFCPDVADGDASDTDKVFIKIRTTTVSSVYPQNDKLAAFIRNIGRDDSQDVVSSIPPSESRELITFAPLLMDQLLYVLGSSKNEPTNYKSFCYLLHCASAFSQKTQSGGKIAASDKIMSFAWRYFDADSAFEAVLTQWVALLKATISFDPDAALPAESSFYRDISLSSLKELSPFLMAIIYKSMVLKLQKDGLLHKPETRSGRFSNKFYKKIRQLFKLIIGHAQKSPSGFDETNTQSARFFIDLSRIGDRGQVLYLMKEYLELLHTQRFAPYRLRFLQMIADYEHFLALNLPVQNPRNSTNETPDVVHWGIRNYVGELKRLLAATEEARITRTKAIAKFRDTMWKHTIDPRYSTLSALTRIAGAYFPFLQIVIESYESFTKLSDKGERRSGAKSNDVADTKPPQSELRDWCICVMWILQHCDLERELLPFWNSLPSESLHLFPNVIRICFETFCEENVLDDCAIVIVRSLSALITHFSDYIRTNVNVFESLTTLLTQLLKYTRSTTAVQQLGAYTAQFIFTFRELLFKDAVGNSLAGDLSFEMLNLCHNEPAATKMTGLTLVYLLLRENQVAANQFSRMKFQSTMALSKLMKQEDCNFTEIQECLGVIERFNEPFPPIPEWATQLRELISSQYRVLRDATTIHEIRDEFSEIKAALLLRLSLEYVNSPPLRVAWLNTLAAYHEKVRTRAQRSDKEASPLTINQSTQMKYLDESAQCRLLIAKLVAEYLENQSPSPLGLPGSMLDFERVAPSVAQAPGLSFSWHEGGVVQSPEFSERGYISALEAAVSLMEKTETYEPALEILSLLQRSHIFNRKFGNLTSVAKEIAQYSEAAASASRMQSRISPNYYRVGFYGNGFGDDNGKEFIYRVPASIRLADFTENLKTRYCAEFGEKNVEILKNKPVEEMKLEKKMNYLQIVSCEVYVSNPDEFGGAEPTFLYKAFNVNKFVFETPYDPDGNAKGPIEDPARSWKRKIIVTTADTFPHTLTRSLIASKEIKLLTPIESAIDVVHTIVCKLKSALNCTPPDAKRLQIILQGSILTQVNAGPVAIVKVFLGNSADHPAPLIAILREQFKAFIRSCDFGLRLNSRLVQESPEVAPLHDALMAAFNKLRADAAQHIDV